MKFFLRGGLGNRLFIISAAVHFKKYFKKSCVVVPAGLETTAFEDRICLENGVEIISEAPLGKLRRVFETKVAPQLSGKIPWKNWVSLDATGCVSLADISKHVGVMGYFQCNQFAGNPSELRFWLKETLEAQGKSPVTLTKPSSNQVALQIRRGDYLKYRHLYGHLPKDYFEKALRVLKAELPDCVIFTDDEQLVRDEFGSWLDEVKFAHEITGSSSALENLYLLSSFERLVISNSSFGWWGAHLSGGVTVAPKTWSDPTIAPSGILKSDWTTIPGFPHF